MKKHIATLVPAICLVVLSTLSVSAKADTLQLTTVSAQAGGQYIYPYGFSVNGSSTTTGLMCMDLNRNVTLGEEWNVTQASVTGSTSYEEEAYIFSQVGGGTYSNADVQWAAWEIFDPRGVHAAGQDTSSVKNLVHAAQVAVAGGLSSSFYSQFVLYIPDTDLASRRDWTDGIPQEFIGRTSPVPEPSSLILFGSGLVGLAGAVRRKLGRA